VELERAGMKGGLESGDKLAAEDTAEHLEADFWGVSEISFVRLLTCGPA
jgi:hypothetical protein